MSTAKSKHSRAPALGHSPLGDLLGLAPPPPALGPTEGPPAPVATSQRPSRAPTTASPTPEASRRSRKVRGTFQIDEGLMERARDAAVFLSGPPHRLNLTRIAETALQRYLDELEREHNRGKSFPRRSQDLHPGRPIGS